MRSRKSRQALLKWTCIGVTTACGLLLFLSWGPADLRPVSAENSHGPSDQRPAFTKEAFSAVVAKDGEDWQQTGSDKDSKVLLYSAYLDIRGGLNVKVIAVLRFRQRPALFCKFHNGQAVSASLKAVNEHWNLRYAAFILTCTVPRNIVESLKLVTVSRHANGSQGVTLQVHRNKKVTSPKGSFALCVKPLHYNYDRATWMVEFVEYYSMIGVQQFFFYNHSVGQRVDKLLRHYAQQGLVTILPWHLDVKSQTDIRTEGLFAALNDCLYRTMDLFNYTIMVDLDEYMVPRQHHDLAGLLTSLGPAGSYVIRNVFFYLYWDNDSLVTPFPESPPDFAPYLLTQYKTRRLQKPHSFSERSKYIVVPHRALEVGNHFVWRHFGGATALHVSSNLVLLHHYRICEFGGFDCLKKPSTVDRTAHRFGVELRRRVLRTCQSVFGPCPLSPPLGSPW